jgi:hypothetical protein
MRVVAIQQAGCKMWAGKLSRTLVRSMAWTYHHYGQLAVNLSPEFNVASIFYKEEKMTNLPFDHRHRMCILQVQRGRSVQPIEMPQPRLKREG